MTDAPVEHRGISRLLAKIKMSMENKNFYEAHQIFRTIYFRFSNQKRYAELLELLYDGADSLITAEQFTSGSDLVLLIIDVLEKSKLEANKDFELWITRISTLVSRIEPNVIERESIIAKSVKWSATGNNMSRLVGHPMMHKNIAKIMEKEKNYQQARHHYLLSKDGIGCAKILLLLTRRAFENEIDLVIVQMVLQLLFIKEKETAQVTFNTYIMLHPKIQKSHPPFHAPLLNFLYYLLNLIDEPQAVAFKTLCDLYKTSLARDSEFGKQLHRIGESYFGIVHRQPCAGSGGGGLFGDLFSQLFADLGSDDESDEDLREAIRDQIYPSGVVTASADLD
ncbi:unnamed protein product [Diamesa serratosioi]